MPLFRRFGRPGLLGLAARTVVVAGTATAVTGAVYGHRQRQAAQVQEAASYQQQQQQDALDQAARDAVAARTQPIPAPPQGVDTVAELQKLAALHDSGALTDAEFQAAKGRLLA